MSKISQQSKNELFKIWLETEFEVTKEHCEECGGFDPILPRKVFKLPRGNYCFEHIFAELILWINGE